MRQRTLRWMELTAWGLGLLLLATYGTMRVHGGVMQRQDLQRFNQAKQDAVSTIPGEIDTSLWSETRIEKYNRSLEHDSPLPLAMLRIPSIRLEVPVLDGTDDFTLNRAVGRIAATARPGEPGNIGIAGHRDGFFRDLKDLSPGDVIELVTLHETARYTVKEIRIVSPETVEVLDPTSEPTLTLVTCYPFYFIGPAPQRYIIRAVLLEQVSGTAQSNIS
jgi:sortase A